MKKVRGAERGRKADRRFVERDLVDEMLLRNVANGDKAAMHIMFARHRAGVIRFIQRMVIHQTLVDDLVGHVFLDAWRSATRLESRARVCTWLVSIARLETIGSPRERAQGKIEKAGVSGIAPAGDIFYACLEKLSPAHREIIDLFYDREKSIAEMSEMTGVPEAVLNSRLFYARKRLARIVASAGFETAVVQKRTKRESGKASRKLCQIHGPPRASMRNAHIAIIVPQESTF